MATTTAKRDSVWPYWTEHSVLPPATFAKSTCISADEEMCRKEIAKICGDVSSAVVIGIVCDGVVYLNRGVERMLRSTVPTVDKLCPLGGLN